MRLDRRWLGLLVALSVVWAVADGTVPVESDSTPAPAPGDHRLPGAGEGSAASTSRTVAQYVIPKLTLLREDGSRASFPRELDDGRAVLVHFIFTSCTTVCPMLSHVFAKLQRELGPDAGKVHLVSISIDPEYDTPERLAAYAEKLGAGPGWNHYTGRLEDIIAIQQAFRVYRSDKMSHLPVALFKAPKSKTWVRYEGVVSPEVLLAEYRQSAATGTTKPAHREAH